MAKELVIRNGFIIYANNNYSEEITGITTDLDISAQLNELASASAIKDYVDVVNSATTIEALSDTTITKPEQTGQTLVWDSGSWINTGISYFYSDLDSRYVNQDGDTMTGNLILPGLTATTIDTTNLEADNLTGTTINSTDIYTTNINTTNLTGDTAYLSSLVLNGTLVNSIQIDNITAPGDNNTLVTTSAVTSYVAQELNAYSTDLSGLTDTTVINPQDGEILVYKTGTEWTNTGVSYILGNYYTKSEADNKFVDITGDTMTGDLIMDTGANITLNQGNLTLNDGDLEVNGDTTILGDLYVSGTTTTVNTKDLNIADNIITINSGETGSGVTLENAGIKVDRGAYDPYYFLFNESTQTFRIGVSTSDDTQALVISGDTQAVATREDDPTTDGVAFWNNVERRFDTDNDFIWNTGTTTLTINGDISITGDVDGVDISDFYNEFNTFTGTTNTFANLNDTTITTPSVGEIAVYLSGTEWTNTGISYFYSDLDSRYVNQAGDTMTGNLTLPGLTATTIDTTNLESDNLTGTTINSTDIYTTNIDSANITGTTINSTDLITTNLTGNTAYLTNIISTTIDSTNINVTNLDADSTTTDTLTLASGITVWSIQNTTGQTTTSDTLLTEEAITNLFETANELGELTDVTLTNVQTNDILIYTGSEWENTGKTYLDDLYVNVDGDTMTGDLTIDPLSGTNDRLVYVDSTGKLQESDEYIYKIPTVSAGVGTTNIDTISSGVSYGSVWHYYVEDGTNYRSGIITSSWGNSSVEFNETSTKDIGDTTNVDFDVVLSAGNIIVQSIVGAGSWNVKVVRMVI